MKRPLMPGRTDQWDYYAISYLYGDGPTPYCYVGDDVSLAGTTRSPPQGMQFQPQRARQTTRKRVMPPCGRCRRVGGDETTTHAWTDGSVGLLRDFIPLWKWAEAVLLWGRRRFVGRDDPFTTARNAVSTITSSLPTHLERELYRSATWAMSPRWRCRQVGYALTWALMPNGRCRRLTMPPKGDAAK